MITIASWQTIALLVVLAAIMYALTYWLWRYTGSRGAAPARPGQPRLIAAAGVCALLFAALTTALLAGDFIATIDSAIRAWVPILHDHGFVRLVTFITSMADIETIVAVTLVAAGLLWAQGRHREVAGLAISVLGSQAATYIGKYAIARERPEFETFASAVTPSYPSAHASAAVAAYGFVVLAIVRMPARPHVRFEITYWGAVVILLIGASRIVLGVHYASDVVAGLLVGGFWLAAGWHVGRPRSA